MLSQIKVYSLENQDINDIMIAGNFNQNICTRDIHIFFDGVKVHNAHSRVNNMPMKSLDKTHVNRSSPASLIVSLEALFCVH